LEITPNGIHFDDLDQFILFARQYNLVGTMKLTDPLQDIKGNILIKENTTVKESALEKLHTIRDQFKHDFTIALTPDLLERIREKLANLILKRLDETNNEFIGELFRETQHNYKGYIKHSFQSKGLALTAFKISGTKQSFFNHLADFGLISLGIAIQKNFRIRFINRYAFLAGFLADICHSGSDNWKYPPQVENAKKEIAGKSAQIAQKIKLPGEVIEAIRNHTITVFPFPSTIQAPLDTGTANDKDFVSVEEDNENFPEDAKADEKASMITTEVLKIARYITDSSLHISDSSHFAEELVYRVAYNSGKGYFHKELIAPILRKFKQYENNIKKLTRIAEIEKECLHPPSAWAYPKPSAAQILCQNRVNECPMLERGWDINVIAKQEAFGWIGVSLEPGDYPKCSLEEKLNEVMKDEF